MPDISDVIRKHTEDALLAEKAFEERLRVFASEDIEDEEIRLLFAEQSEDSHLLAEKLQSLTGQTERASTNVIAAFLDIAPRLAQAAHTREERVVQNLIAAGCMIAGQLAIYETLGALAHDVGDLATEALAREIQAAKQQFGAKLFRFIPSRSKIAYNVLTAHEIDPSVETKVGLS